ncbi:MAG: hypothetical protein Salg2KO_16920 [Salibacteraceae bacterium]
MNPRKRFTLYTLLLLSYTALGQTEVSLIAEYGLAKSLYEMTSNNADLIAPQEYTIPFGIGLRVSKARYSLDIVYENRNFRETGPRFNTRPEQIVDLGGGGSSNRIHSLNLIFGVDLLPKNEKFELVPEIGFGIGSMPSAIIVNREPTFQDSMDYTSYSHVLTEPDTAVLQSGRMHSLSTSNHINWARVGLRVSYGLSHRWRVYMRMAYTHGLNTFNKAIFEIDDITLDEPIMGTVSYSGTTLALRFGLSYTFIGKEKNQ